MAKNPQVYVSLTPEQITIIKQLADDGGWKSISEFLRHTLIEALDLPQNETIKYGDPMRFPNNKR